MCARGVQQWVNERQTTTASHSRTTVEGTRRAASSIFSYIFPRSGAFAARQRWKEKNSRVPKSLLLLFFFAARALNGPWIRRAALESIAAETQRGPSRALASLFSLSLPCDLDDWRKNGKWKRGDMMTRSPACSYNLQQWIVPHPSIV